ncbi:MAG: HAMP domain-containing histidine kinase [Clostridia bacterium]|nr:HAMP domain-containing histidine kinase [Clostridia bacterium]
MKKIKTHKPKDAFLSTRIKFTFFCGLISFGLLLVIFAATLFANYRVVYDSVLENMAKAVTATTNETPEEIPASCLVFRYLDEKTLTAENAESYAEETLYVIADNARKHPNQKFTIQGRTYVSHEVHRDNLRFIAVFDATEEVYYLHRSVTVLFIGLILGGIALVLISWFYSYYVVKPAKDAFYKQRELVANASHELKTPLTVIAANLSLVQSEPTSTVQENEKWLTAVDSQVKRMNSLVLEMLDLCRTEQHDLYAEREEIDVSALLAGSVLCVEAACYEKDVSLSLHAEENLLFRTNRAAMEKLTLILLDNAVKYCEKGGTISVHLKRKRKALLFAVSNTGKGISAEEQKHVFERFYKGDASHHSVEPTSFGKSFGLGLSIAEAIAKELGGALSCRSQDGVTTFSAIFFE